MSRLRLFRSFGIAVFGILLLAACSGESLSEFTIDQALDASGEDVDFDFEDGGFSISGEDGEVTFNFDSEDGTFSFDSDDGSGTVQFDDEGNVRFDTDESSGTATIDEQGNIVVETDEGDATFNIDADAGSATFSSDDGTGFTSQAVPENWPEFFGAPATLIADQSVFSVFDDATGTSFTAFLAHDPAEDFAGAVEARLEAAGFERVEFSGVSGFSQWQGQGLYVTLTGSDGQTSIVAAPDS
jgi:hypothetical protein